MQTIATALATDSTGDPMIAKEILMHAAPKGGAADHGFRYSIGFLAVILGYQHLYTKTL
ncbi:MAG: hypothetical protein ACREQR_06680 [Candidatus Binataceae bacterium]